MSERRTTHEVPPLTRPETALLTAVAVLGVGVGGLGLISSFQAVSAAGARWGFTTPALLPIGIDTAIPVFTAVNLLLVRMNMPLAWVRFVPWALTGVTCWLNIAAGHSLSAKLAHGTMPLLWVVLSEVAAHVYAVRIGAVTGRRMEKIRRSRWLLAPASTFALWRRMTLWEITSYTDALARERERQLTRADLRERHGRRWRSRTPRRARVLLRLGELAPAEPAESVELSALTPAVLPEPARETAAIEPERPRVSLTKAQVNPSNPQPGREPGKASATPRTKQVAAARTAAALTARASVPEEKEDARAWVLAQLRAGHTVAWRALAARSGRGETWCRARIREAEQTFGDAPSAEGPDLHLADASRDTPTRPHSAAA